PMQVREGRFGGYPHAAISEWLAGGGQGRRMCDPLSFRAGCPEADRRGCAEVHVMVAGGSRRVRFVACLAGAALVGLAMSDCSVSTPRHGFTVATGRGVTRAGRIQGGAVGAAGGAPSAGRPEIASSPSTTLAHLAVPGTVPAGS